MYQHQDPLGRHSKKGGGQGRQRGVGRTMGSAEPALAPVQVHFGGKITLILQKSVADVSILILAGTNVHKLYKGPPSPHLIHTTKCSTHHQVLFLLHLKM